TKALFAQEDRSLSHGCIRLEDAERLGRWLLGRNPETTSRDPEQNVLLPTPVPIYLTYLTAQVTGGGLSFVDDPYRRDGERTTDDTVWALRVGVMARERPRFARQREDSPDGPVQLARIAARKVGARRAIIGHEQGVADEHRVADSVANASRRVAGRRHHFDA